MKQKKLFFVTIVLSLFLVISPMSVFAQAAGGGASGGGGGVGMDPKAEVMLTMSAYGAVGGALLGVASLAYGTEFRAVFIGASLGLYAGIIFGGYILASHYYMKQARSVPQVSSPYYDDSAGSEDASYHWQPQRLNKRFNFNPKTEQRSHVPLFYMNLLNYSF